MKNMYNLVLRSFFLLSLFSKVLPNKLSLWFIEQKLIFKKVKRSKSECIWIHCSSVGEYESIKFLLKDLNKINSNIFLTFSSVSGIKYFKYDKYVESFSLMPIDIYSRMKLFIEKIKPQVLIISNNDVWPNTLEILNKKGIPILIVGNKININKQSSYLYALYIKKFYSKISYIFCVDKNSCDYLTKIGIKNHKLIGNSRLNQILDDFQKKNCESKIKKYLKSKTLIYASISKIDYPIIQKLVENFSDFKHIIVPHEYSEKQFNEISSLFPQKMIKYSSLNHSYNNENLILIDKFGLLKNIYRYTDLAYIGGGLDVGVHNTTEAAIHGNYLLFGPNYENFDDAKFYVNKEIALVVKNVSTFKSDSIVFDFGKTNKTKNKKIVFDYIQQCQISKESIINIVNKILN